MDDLVLRQNKVVFLEPTSPNHFIAWSVGFRQQDSIRVEKSPQTHLSPSLVVITNFKDDIFRHHRAHKSALNTNPDFVHNIFIARSFCDNLTL